MRKTSSDGLWVWLLSAVAFFALVIVYFLGPRLFSPLAGGRPAPAPYAPAALPDPAVSTLPTAPIRMKIKRIEPRKYRREGDLPPPSPVARP
ncbi:hypothetical protein EPO15_15870 [bacterium]|nr:MAG: hypothetical protein EPO15_15870 [bacterium]